MNILVCISKVPDTTSKISFINDNKTFNEDKIQYILNPYDEWYALVRALELKEAAGAGSVTVINVGLADNEQIIRKALAIGADDAVRVNANPEDAFSIANYIAEYAKTKTYSIIMAGKESIDHNGSAIGAMVAELLDMPYVSLATKLDVNGDTATLEREIEGGKEVIECKLPLVLSANKGLAEQRIASMRGIMASRTKAIEVIEPNAVTPLVTVNKFGLPTEKTTCKMIPADQIELLITALHNEAKVI
jgi:electron transfer flavoprotein beta subunit